MVTDYPEDKNIFELYKLYVEMSDNLSQRRLSTNNYLLTVNSVLISFHGFTHAILKIEMGLWQLIIPVVGMLVCMAWRVLLVRYQQLNKAKFDVIHEMELNLPYDPYTREWKIIKTDNKVKDYQPMSKTEANIPIYFLSFYFILEIISMWNLLVN